jgi:hypothetical protein
LAGADVLRTIGAAREGVVIKGTPSSFQPSMEAGTSRLQQLELDRPAGLLLGNCGSVSHSTTADEFPDPDSHDVAATQFAIDGKVE